MQSPGPPAARSAQHLRDREHPLGVADVGQHLLLEEGGECCGTFGGAGGAQAAALAGEGDQELGTAGAAPHAGEAVVQDAAVEVAANSFVGESPPEAIVAHRRLGDRPRPRGRRGGRPHRRPGHSRGRRDRVRQLHGALPRPAARRAESQGELRDGRPATLRRLIRQPPRRLPPDSRTLPPPGSRSRARGYSRPPAPATDRLMPAGDCPDSSRAAGTGGGAARRRHLNREACQYPGAVGAFAASSGAPRPTRGPAAAPLR